MAQLNDKYAKIDWDKFRRETHRQTRVTVKENAAQKHRRITRLEADPQAWKQYYFPNFFSAPSPEFHLRASRRVLKNFTEKGHWYEVRNWARGLAKTTVTRMDVLYLVLTGKLHFVLYISSTYDAAAAFLNQYQVQLDSNQRIISDYGKQASLGNWSAGDFTTLNGTRFMALGARQSPRGQAINEFRPDCIICDDFDTDEECRNLDIITQKWDWFEKAVMFAVDIAKPYLIMWLGNIIAPDCCVLRAGEKADCKEVVNIRDEAGKSVWADKNSEVNIDAIIAKTSWEAVQQELFNNPVRQGQTFKEITWGKCPPLKDMTFVVSYSDPATSNRDKPAAKSKVSNSCKGTALVGCKDGKYYLYTCILDNMSNDHFIEGMYAIRDYAGGWTPLYNYIENNTLQNPFFEQVLRPLIYQHAKNKKILALAVIPDEEKKGEKWYRIEADLEPLFRLATFIFNEDEKNNPHMQRMASQFLTATPNSRTLDGPDMIQGAVRQIIKKQAVIAVGGIYATPRQKSKNWW